MKAASNNVELWNKHVLQVGHTGYSDQVIYTYDQPLRIKAVRRVLHRLYPNGLAGLETLDIGCGTGDFIQLLVELGSSKVQAVDISNLVVEKARERFAQVPSVSIEVGRIQNKISNHQSLDLITSITVLQHLLDDEDAVKAIENIARSLKQEGLIIALEVSPTKPVLASSPQTIKERTLEEWQAIFAMAGVTLISKPQVYSPLGFCLVQLWLPDLIKRILAIRWRRIYQSGQGDNWQVVKPKSKTSGKRNLVRSIYSMTRWLMLRFTYPLDRMFQFRVPDHIAYYHIFVLRKTLPQEANISPVSERGHD